MNRILSVLVLLSLLLTACATPAASASSIALTVAAASDLQFAFTELGALFEQETGHPVTFVFGSTGQLAQQIENGAPYDLFAAANLAFIERLVQKNLVLPESVQLYARGRIVLAVNQQTGIQVTRLEDLLSARIQHVAIANPEHAPYGIAAMEALQSAGLWEALQPKLVYGDNVRQALQFIQTGDAEAGIVALSVANVPEITWTLIDERLHNPLNQALAVVTTTPHRELAQKFIDFVQGPVGRPIMQKYGFILPVEADLSPRPE
ncbi:MAG: molybdate ABC transporter substrate-binding protein [Anaerolineales bacterium]|nr:molybdate ABC transporter substrate-binding protein [Anaerolineales bacterium]MCX7753630.1 molybdate ABC transporter substrate-binding protein [Anaerolineales bacterium]MDW8277720.1 molybdate ABC transporter substrate-binding protein [Anaerolineales bacterium]